MAKSKKELGEFDFNDDLDFDKEFGSLDTDYSFENTPIKEGSRTPVDKAIRKVGKGFKDSVKNTATADSAAKLAKRMIPKQLSSEMADMLSVHSELNDKIKESIKELKTTGRTTIRSLDRIIPTTGKIRKLLDNIKAKLGDEETTQAQIQKENQAEIIATALNEVFGEQNKQDRYNELIKQSLEEKRFKTSLDSLSSIAAHTENVTRFNREITSNYYRQSLKLQYQSLFTSTEQLRVLKSGVDIFKTQLESIVHNTALPDILKSRNLENMKETIAANARQKVSDLFYSDSNPLTALRRNGVKKIAAMTQSFKDGLEGTGELSDMYADNAEMMEMMGGSSYVLGQTIGDTIKDKLAAMVGNRLGKTKKGKDTIFKTKDTLMDLNEFARKGSMNDEDSLSGSAKRSLFGLLYELTSPNKTNDISFKKQNLSDPSMLDIRTKDSINKIIPGLLSKIYGEVKATRLKDGSPIGHELYYDHTSSQFLDKRLFIGSIKKNVALKMNRAVTYPADSLINKYQTDAGIQFSNEDKAKFRKSIVKYFTDGGSIAPSAIAGEKFLSYFPKDMQGKLYAGGNKLLAMCKEDSGYMDYLNSDLRSIKSALPNINTTLSELHESGYSNIGVMLGGMEHDVLNGGFKYSKEGVKKILSRSMDNITQNEIERQKEWVHANRNKHAKRKNKIYENIDSIYGSVKDSLGRKKKSFPKPTGVTDGGISDSYNFSSDDVAGKKELTSEETEQIRSEYFGSREFRNGDAPSFKEWANSLGRDVKYTTKTEHLNEVENTTSVIDKIKDVFSTLSKDKISLLRTEFFMSKEYKEGKVKNFKRWCESLGIEVSVKDIIGDDTHVNEDMVSKVKKSIFNKIKDVNVKLENTEDIEHLQNKFYSSNEYKTGIMTDFHQWASDLGYDINYTAKPVMKRMFKQNARSLLNSARSIDKRFRGAAPGLLWDTVKFGAKLPWNISKYGGKGARGLYRGYKSDAVQNMLSKTRAADKTIMKNAPGALWRGAKGGFNLLGKTARGASSIINAIGNIGMFALGKGGNEKEAKGTVNPDDVFDRDKSGRNDGDWRDRIDKVNAKHTASQNVAAKVGSSTSVFDLLKKFLPFAAMALGKLMSFGGTLVKLVKFLPGALMRIIPGIGKFAGAVGGGAVSLIGGMATGASGIAGIGRSATTVAEGATIGSKLAGVGSKVAAALTPSSIIGKITGVLEGFKSTMVKRLGAKASVKMIAVIGAKVAARAIPFIGEALLAYDAVCIVGLMIMGYSLTSAVSKHILGFDINDTKEAILDEDGNPVAPDAPITQKDSESVKDNDGSIWDKTKNTANALWDKTKENAVKATTYLGNKANEAGGYIADKATSAYNTVSDAASTAKNTVVNTAKKATTAAGNAYDSFKDKIGNFFATGSFDNSKLGPAKAQIMNMLDDVSDQTGVNANMLKTFAAIESGVNPNSSARPASSASGLFQFLDSTWRSMLSKYGGKYGLDSTASVFDPKANALMGAEYIKENAKAMVSTKPNPTATDLYMAHFLGAGGAKKFFKADPSAIGANLMPAEARSNGNIFYSKSGQPRTIGEIYDDFNKKMVNKAMEYGFRPGAIADAKPQTNTGGGSDEQNINSGTTVVNTTDAGSNIAGVTPAVSPIGSNSNTNAITAQPASASSGSVAPSISEAVNNAVISNPVTKTDTTKIALATDTNGILGNAVNILKQSLDTQIKMATSLDRIEVILRTSGGNMVDPAMKPANINTDTSTTARASKITTDMPEAAVSVRQARI